MITILMPIYNGIEFIEESVSSIIQQKYSDWELIIGINGHPQNSIVYKKAKEYEIKYPYKIRVFDFYKIKGKSNTLNEMLKYSNYDYIALLDVDDIWHENKLKVQSVYLGKYDVIGSSAIYFGDLNIIPNIPINDISKFNFFQFNPVINSSSIIKKELCYWNAEFDGVEDYDLWLTLKIQNKKFFNCPDIFVKHRIHNTSSFNAKGNNNLVKNLLKKHIQKI